MKRLLLPFLFFIFTGITSCSKFENGPWISFKSEEKRLEGEWLLKHWTVDGVDSLQYWNAYFGNECKFTFNPWSGNAYLFSIDWGFIDSNYYYVFGGHLGFAHEYLTVVAFFLDENSTAAPLNFLTEPHPTNSLVQWTVTKLKYKDLWFEMDVDDKHYELHFENIKKD